MKIVVGENETILTLFLVKKDFETHFICHTSHYICIDMHFI